MIRERVLAVMSRAAASGTRSGKPIGRPRIEPETEASIRAALQKGDLGMRKVAVQFGVATGTVQRMPKASPRPSGLDGLPHQHGRRQVLSGHARRVRRVRNQPAARASARRHRQG